MDRIMPKILSENDNSIEHNAEGSRWNALLLNYISN